MQSVCINHVVPSHPTFSSHSMTSNAKQSQCVLLQPPLLSTHIWAAYNEVVWCVFKPCLQTKFLFRNQEDLNCSKINWTDSTTKRKHAYFAVLCKMFLFCHSTPIDFNWRFILRTQFSLSNSLEEFSSHELICPNKNSSLIDSGCEYVNTYSEEKNRQNIAVCYHQINMFQDIKYQDKP